MAMSAEMLLTKDFQVVMAAELPKLTRLPTWSQHFGRSISALVHWRIGIMTWQ